jgi:DNA polymerase III sliding clamp (beta) subunit (PCNA family)
MAGAFPHWQLAVPKDFQAFVTVDSQELLSSINRCLLMGDQKTHAIKLEFGADRVIVRAADALGGEAEEIVDANGGPKEPVHVGANGAYLSKALKLATGDIAIKLPRQYGAFLLSWEPAEGESFDYVVMPLRIS